ncbi:hypothetical protein [Deinococcus radiophilus]|uniref:Uncharacterized protein n=1 Tax=Deinococcus radiophilus TaxID=32062 RepID=A0A3S0K6N0_9DEIO|nr:hypothetical protein [Deinococcus radiophilus]RTR22846.1 hypothetical protein EJ104_12670 [Deinococcus radiophilus]
MIGLLPDYFAAGALDTWHRACCDVLAEGHTPADRITEALFEFARRNLYAQFDPELAEGDFRHLAGVLPKHGIRPPDTDTSSFAAW